METKRKEERERNGGQRKTKQRNYLESAVQYVGFTAINVYLLLLLTSIYGNMYFIFGMRVESDIFFVGLFRCLWNEKNSEEH